MAGNAFNFGGTNGVAEQKPGANNQPPVEGVEPTPSAGVEGIRDVERMAPYTDRRSVTIALARTFNKDLISFYRRANDKAIPKKNDYIGSSINSSQILSSNKDEIEAYFPALLGVAPNNEAFITRVKQWLNNIQVAVDEIGKKLDTSFYYNHKHDYERIKAMEDNIEATYQAIDRHNSKALREGLKEKIAAINALESTKHQFGHPLNVSDYLIYRHCLLYNDVAKDLSFINSDPNIRFYFKDDKREAEKARKFRTDILKAKQNFVECMADPSLFEAVYIQCCIYNKYPILNALALSDIEKETRLDKFSTEEPLKFNKICANKDNKLIATIEKLIAHGDLTRMEHNQNILTSDGQFIGSNMTEAVAWFKNPENSAIVLAYTNRLNNI